jgi:signal peptidase I
MRDAGTDSQQEPDGGSAWDFPPHKTPPPLERAPWWRSARVREIIETLCLALLIFVAVRVVVLNFRVDGLSMESSLHDGQMLLVNRNAYATFDTWALVDWLPGVAHDPHTVHLFSPPQRGDIVVLTPPGEGDTTPYIKRIIGLPGETVHLRDDGVYIDGVHLEEPYLDPIESMCASQTACGPFTVPPGHVFVLGDNRSNSLDSPDFGPVPVEDIIGKAWIIYWPPGDVGIVPDPAYPAATEHP